MAVTQVPGRYQCAETATTARGRGSARPMAAQASVYALRSMAFIGLPCPKKKAGIVGPARSALRVSAMEVMRAASPQPTPERAQAVARPDHSKCERKTPRTPNAAQCLKSPDARDSLHRFSIPPGATQRRLHPGRSCESEHAGRRAQSRSAPAGCEGSAEGLALATRNAASDEEAAAGRACQSPRAAIRGAQLRAPGGARALGGTPRTRRSPLRGGHPRPARPPADDPRAVLAAARREPRLDLRMGDGTHDAARTQHGARARGAEDGR